MTSFILMSVFSESLIESIDTPQPLAPLPLQVGEACPAPDGGLGLACNFFSLWEK